MSTQLTHKQILVVIGGLMAGMFLAALDQSIVGTALPRIVSEMGGLDKLSWVVTAYLLTSTAATPLWGKLSDLYGRRLMFQVSISIFIAGSLVSALTVDMLQLVLARAVQGVGGGGLMALAFAIIADVIPARDRGRYTGYFGSVWGVSSIAGPLLGGFFADGPGWRWIFWINLPLGIAALVITSGALKGVPVVRRQRSIDYLGAALIVAAISALLLYLSWSGPAYGWAAPQALGLLAAGLVLGVLFVWAESRAEEPIIPLKLFRNSIFSVGNLYGALSGFVMFGAMIFLPLYLQIVKGMSPTVSGLAMLPAVAGIFASSTISGQLMSRTGRYKIFLVLGGAVLVGALSLMTTMAADTSFWLVAAYAFGFGFGTGFTMQIATAVQNSVSYEDMGAAIGAMAFFREMGAAVGTAVFGVVLSTRLTHHLAVEGVRVPAGTTDNVEAIAGLPPALHERVIGGFVHAIDDVFLAAVPFAALLLIAALFVKEIALATGNAWSEADDRAAQAEVEAETEVEAERRDSMRHEVTV